MRLPYRLKGKKLLQVLKQQNTLNHNTWFLFTACKKNFRTQSIVISNEVLALEKYINLEIFF